MKVKDLIQKLGKFDPEIDVIIQSSNFELQGNLIDLKHICLYYNGKKEIKTFRDSVDYEVYKTETYNIVGGDIPVILIS